MNHSEATSANSGRSFKRIFLVIMLILADFVAINFSYIFGLWIRFDCKYQSIPEEYLNALYRLAPVYSLVAIVIFALLNLYRSVWKFASVNEFIRSVGASLIASVLHTVAITLLVERMPISYYVVGAIVQVCLIVGIRFAYRFILSAQRYFLSLADTKYDRKHVMIIGAGQAGKMLSEEIRKMDNHNSKVVCFIDDDASLRHRYVDGIRIFGGRDDIMAAVEQYKVDTIFFAIPTASPEEKRDILSICRETGCELKSLPGVYQIVKGDVLLKKMKSVAIEDLLGRDTIKVNMGEIFDQLKGKTILVTGGGGSIGSELCRQIAGHSPKHLIIFDIYENNAYAIEQELKRAYKDQLNLTVLIGSVRDTRRINSVFETYKPDIVYHAAAHKHVPLMETSPCEAIKNNVMGTYKTAYAAMKNNCQRFVLISTDKAVNPTNIMGASKRLCEMVIQSMDKISKQGAEDKLPLIHAHKEDASGIFDPMDYPAVAIDKQQQIRTEFVAVRFGNVLGSNGSVVPLFKKQIAAGGPVTVTHPDIIRYFMTIPEAVSLVLQAGTYAKGGEIFVLDMGQPVKIDTLARNLIKLSGYTPDVDIKIVYTGLRPGEKLCEETLMAEEGMTKTDNQLIFIGKPIELDVDEFFGQLTELAAFSYRNDEDIVAKVSELVPTFITPEKFNAKYVKENAPRETVKV